MSPRTVLCTAVGWSSARPIVRSTSQSCRRHAFHTSQPARASILFALQALSNSRETQHFNKISRLDRVDHSPSLSLIKSSEVDPFPSQSKAKIVRPTAREHGQDSPERAFPDPTSRHRPGASATDLRARAIGHAILSSHARTVRQLSRNLRQLKHSATQRDKLYAEEKNQWEKERRHLRNEIRSAGGMIVLAVGVATGLAVWKFGRSSSSTKDAVQAEAAIPGSAVVTAPVVEAVPFVHAATQTVSPLQPMNASTPPGRDPSRALSWRDLLWKKQ